MARLDQKPKEPVCTLLIVDRHPWVIQFFIVIIVKNNGDIFLVNLHIAIQIGIHQAGFYAVHDKTLKILMNHRLQTAPFVGKLIIRQKNTQIHLIRQQDAPYPFDQSRIRIGILPLQHQPYFDRSAVSSQFFCQDRKSVV